MKTQTQPQITGEFDWQMPKVIPSFVSGPDAQAVYELVKTLGSVGYDPQSRTMWGSNLPVAASLDTKLRELGIGRVATLRDLSRPEVMEMIRDRFYTDSPTLVLRTTEDTYSPNNAVIQGLLPHIEQKQGALKLPVMITGFDAVPTKRKEGYQFDIVPRDDFAVVHDARLAGSYDGKTFSEVDELGLPNFDKKGNRTLYTRNGLSRLYLNRNLNLGSYDEDLADSFEGGRVVVIRGEADGADLLNKYMAEVNAKYQRQKSELSQRRDQALEILRGNK